MTPCRLQWNLVLLNFMTCGLEICVAAGITYVPPLLLEAGVEERYMTMVLGIGPVLGLILVPLIGSASDNCQSNYGGRRPFIWLLSLGVLLSLFIIPHADSLASYFSYGGNRVHIFFLIFGVGLLDCCVQVCFTPLEALLSDLYHDDESCGQAFAMFSLMISVGGCIGYLLTSVNWNYTYVSLYLGGQDECLFLLLTVIFLISVLVTMKTAEEHGHGQQALDRKPSVTSMSFTRGCCIPKWKLRSWKCNPIFCLLSLCWSVTPRIYHSYCRIPAVMKQLCAAQLCSWMAVMSFMLFYTDFVGEGLYKGIPSAAPGTESRIRYDEGIRMGSLGLFLQCATSTFFSMIINKLAKQFGSRKVYLSSMITFTSSALVICLSQNIVIVTIMSSLTGFAYATLQTLPYTLICLYHKEKEVFMPRPVLPNIRNEKTLTKEAVYFSPNIPASHQNGTCKHKGLNEEEGIRMGSLGLFLQCATSTFFSMIINKLAKQFGSRKVYLSSMITFTSSALVICLSQNIVIVTIMSSLTGFAYATLQTLPYTLICLYHKEKEVFMPRPVLPNIRNEKTLTKEAVYFSPNIPASHQNGTCKHKGLNEEEGIYITQELDAYPPPEDHPYYPTDNNNQTAHGDDKSHKDVYAKRGIGLDFATLDSAFLLSQVFPSLFMGMFVQLMESVTVYIASSVVFGVFAIYLANRVVFDQKDLRT